MKKNLGITLIALVITIVVLLILSAVSIRIIMNGGLINKAGEAGFKAKMAEYREKTDLYVLGQKMQGVTNTDTINSGEMLKQAILDGFILDLEVENVTIDIRDIIPNISVSEEEYIVVYKGVMHYVSNPNVKNNKRQEQMCRDLDIPILEYSPPKGIVIVNGKYEFVDGIYVCTPDLTKGFIKDRTRYLEVGSNGSLVPGNWVTHRPTENWYSYKEKKWANIYIENAGQELYYTWIPRYCFKLNQETERAEVEFIDVDNSYKDPEGNVTTWEQRIAQDNTWQVPEAFKFNGKEIPGYWVSKYTVGDAISPTTINYDMAVIKGKAIIKNITLNTSITNVNKIASYTVALNGKVIQKITDSNKVNNIGSQTIEIDNLRKGNNTINLTALNSKGEVVGSMTKEYNSPVVNEPDLSGFNKETTFYVTYDAKGNEHSTIPISKQAPEGWYDYGSSEWANIVTRNNDGEVYYVWIPRYQFKLDQANQRSTVRFIQGTGTAVETGYQIPEAFKFNGKELTGYWTSKYTTGDIGAPTFESEITTTNNQIKTKGIKGSGVTEGLIYNYYINGEKKGSTKNENENFIYSGLSANTTYTIQIEARNSATDEYKGSVTKQVKTQIANVPDLSGFKAEVTHYVLYDESGNETIGDKITNNGSNMPKNWYDYSERKWANIVVKNGNSTTYYTWVPRYEFKITEGQYAQPAKGRTEVSFIQGTSTNVTPGYQIPEAFKFNGKELTGYWVSKYTVGN